MSGPPSAALDNTLAAWSLRWFTDYALTRRRVIFGAPSPSMQSVASTDRLDIFAASTAWFALLRSALNEDVERIELDEADWSLLDALRNEILQDLAQSVDAVFSADTVAPARQAPDTSGPVLVELADGSGRVVLAIAMTRAIVGETRRAALPDRRAVTPDALIPLRSAIADAVVTLEVRLGSASLPVREARGLAPGDVIILDRSLDRPLELLSQTGTRVAAARMTDPASPRSLRLEPASSREPA